MRTIEHNKPPQVELKQHSHQHNRWLCRIKELCPTQVGTRRVFDLGHGKVRGECVACEFLGFYESGNALVPVIKLTIQPNANFQHVLYVNKLQCR